MPLDSMPKLPSKGSEVQFTMLRGGKPVIETTMVVMSISLDEQAQMFNDKYVGRLRDRMDKKVVGYNLTFSGDVTDLSIVQALIAIQKQVEAYTPADSLSFTFEHTQRDGNFDQFGIVRCVAKWSLNVGGKDESNKFTINAQGEDLIGL